MKKYLVAACLNVVFIGGLMAQQTQEIQEARVVDKVAATVGAGIILQSEIDREYAQHLANGNPADDAYKCTLLQQLLVRKLLAQQAVIDSIDVTESEVDDNINQRLRYMTQQMGGKERLEKFLNRSTLQYKEEMRPNVYELLKANRMQQSITSGIDVTPMEVKRYFESLDNDSLPNFGTEVEVGEIVIFPKLNREEKEVYRKKAEEFRQKVVDGDDFALVAKLYSEDPGSSPFGGDLGFKTREDFVKEFSAVTFRLKPGEISQVFESEFGFHFVQVLERRGEEIRSRHILVQIKPNQASLARTKAEIDSIQNLVTEKKMDFYTAATRFSDNKESKFNGGMLLDYQNQSSRTTYIPVENLEAGVFAAIDNLQPGEYSKPQQFTAEGGKVGYRFHYLKSRTAPHQANLDQDFAKIKEAALQDKINRKLSEWFAGRRKVTYIHISEEFNTCDELKIWFK